MASEPKAGALLRVLAASKPHSRFLELGTGTGLGTSWLLAGMDGESTLDSVDNDPAVVAVAKRHLDKDPRVRFHVGDGGEFLERLHVEPFDFIYADAWPGKFTHLQQALSILRVGGIYLVDDLLPQQNWPDGHDTLVARLIADLEGHRSFAALRLAWSSGIMLLVRTRG
jgi:predicted O-methyltransferase YrrM